MENYTSMRAAKLIRRLPNAFVCLIECPQRSKTDLLSREFSILLAGEKGEEVGLMAEKPAAHLRR